MRVYARRGMRGLGQSYSTVSTASGDYQVVANADGSQTIFDPNGTPVSSIPSGTAPAGFVGPLQGTQTYSTLSATSPSLASMFPGLIGNTTVAGVSVPSWLVPVSLIAGAFILYKAFTK